VKDAEGALWRRQDLDRNRVIKAPPLERIVIGVDPPGGTRTECGIVADGISRQNGVIHLYTLEDASMSGTPDEWATQVVALYYKLQADCIAAEDNFGGDMVESNIKHIDPNVNIKHVHAARGKIPRAEPIATLSQEGREHHVGNFHKLEDEQCTYRAGMPSPNRMDAHVWASTELVPIAYIMGASVSGERVNVGQAQTQLPPSVGMNTPQAPRPAPVVNSKYVVVPRPLSPNIGGLNRGGDDKIR
jgi:phage terminase large subunit-like protein